MYNTQRRRKLFIDELLYVNIDDKKDVYINRGNEL